jgi:hypothetical protein
MLPKHAFRRASDGKSLDSLLDRKPLLVERDLENTSNVLLVRSRYANIKGPIEKLVGSVAGISNKQLDGLVVLILS